MAGGKERRPSHRRFLVIWSSIRHLCRLALATLIPSDGVRQGSQPPRMRPTFSGEVVPKVVLDRMRRIGAA
jgi:hypothetical protein